MTRCSIFSTVQYPDYKLRTIGVTRSYSSHPFLCALAQTIARSSQLKNKNLTTLPPPLFALSLKASPAYCLVVNEQYLFCGCSEGVIRIFDPRTLDYLVTVPKPHSLGVDVAAALDAR